MSVTVRSGRRRRLRAPALAAIAAAAAVSGAGLLVTGLATPTGAAGHPVVAAVGNVPATGGAPAARSGPAPAVAAPVSPGPLALPASSPISLRIPAIGVDTRLVELGLNPDRTVEVPADYARAGWYDGAPDPGQLGPAVILGHIDSYRGPAVFFRLGRLRPGDTAMVERADHSTAEFVVDAIRDYPKDAFPTEMVYGPVEYAGLRLISCGGPFDTATRQYRDNIVVYAHLSAARPAAR